MKKQRIIAPSILAADFLNLGDEIEMLNNSKAQWIHYDVMDGVFVPNMSFGLAILSQISAVTSKPIDVHLMIADPNPYIKAYKEAGASNITVHYESCKHLHRTIQAIKDEGISAGVCLNPHSPVSLLEEIITDVDLVLIMGVNPGFGGQSFIETTYEKVEKLKKLIEQKQSNCHIEVDGGVTDKTAKKLYAAGANVLVSGSYVFKSDKPSTMISKLLNV